MPSPRFWKTCGSRVNIACETQSTPSPPIWIRPSVSRSIQLAMKWQPMPACAREPSGTFVERLCGQPAQNHGARRGASGAPAGRCGTVKSTTRVRRSSRASCAASQAATGSISREGRSSPSSLSSGAPERSRLPISAGRASAGAA